MIERLLALALVVAALVLDVGCIPKKAGDPCDLEADDCPEAFVCEAVVGGVARCHVRVGGACDALADVEQFCAAGTSCADDPAGGEGDAVCGGVGSPCPKAACVEGLVCRSDDGGPICTVD